MIEKIYIREIYTLSSKESAPFTLQVDRTTALNGEEIEGEEDGQREGEIDR